MKTNRGVLSLRAADTFSTAFCVFMTEICFLLFFHISRRAVTSRRRKASKSWRLLIKTSAHNTNLFKRTLIQMSLYGHLTTSHPRLNTNLFKLLGIMFPSPFGEGLGVRSTNQIQREFLFNNHICSQNEISRLSKCPKTTNLFKLLQNQKGRNFSRPYRIFLRVLCVLRGESCFYPIVSTLIFASPSATCKSVSCPARTTQAIGPSRAPR
jgi:hypothetical protein